MTLESYTLGWAFTVLLCFKLYHGASGDCGPPPVKPNTNLAMETSGQTVVYTCDRTTGYYEIPNKSTTITCQADGTWTDIEDFCIRACGVPLRLQFAEPKEDAVNQNIFLPNATVHYDCRPGFVKASGMKNFITCLENYKWSTPEEFCKRKSCGNPGDVDNGNFEATDFLFGSKVTYTCNEGYRLLSRRNYRDCQTDGTWSNAVPQCEAVICPAPHRPANGDYYPEKGEYNYLDSVTFSCQEQFEVAGTGSISCTASGDWSAGTPTCKAVSCSDPVVDNSRRMSGFVGPYKLNSAISFECNKGFVLNGSRSIVCNIDSEWEPIIPKCERVSCGHPGTVLNGQKSVSHFFIGSKATYTCNEGYALTSSMDYRICQENGFWTGSTPKCAAFCKDLPTFPFAMSKETSAGDRKYFNGTVLHYVCNKGFKISPGKESKITCTGHSWSAHDDFCIRISCGDPEKIKNGRVTFLDSFYGSRATYTCEEGYVMNSTQDYRECQADGSWSRPIACTDERVGPGLSVVAIVGIVVIVLVVAATVVCFIIILCKCISKKKKRGKLQPDTPNVQYNHCTAYIPEERKKVFDVPE